MFFLGRYIFKYVGVEGYYVVIYKWFRLKINKDVYIWRENDKVNVGRC